MGYPKETKTQKLVGIEVQANRTKWLFSRGDGSDKPDGVSAFPPYENLSTLKIGEVYQYEQENVPMLDDENKPTGKNYHNFTRKNGSYGKGNANGDFNITYVPPDAYEAPAPKQQTLNPAPTVTQPKPESHVPKQINQDGYWQRKFDYEVEVANIVMNRRVSLDYATRIISAFIAGGEKLNQEQAKTLSITMAKAFENFTLTGALPKDVQPQEKPEDDDE